MKSKKFLLCGRSIPLGETRDLHLPVSESYTGQPVSLLIRVIRGPKPGPTVLLTGVIHGDELNGLGVIRHIMLRQLQLKRGTLICIPIVNIFGFENHSRYLPDRRDLNRSFPGLKKGTLATRLSHRLFSEIVKKCDVGLDLHAAAIRRTNFPQIRADLSHKQLRDIAFAFGCELVIDKKGHPQSLRSTATEAGCPTLLYEAGEVFKIEPGAVEIGVRGVLNVLRHLRMLDGKIIKPAYQTPIHKTKWIRSDRGGLLQFHVRPGDLVKEGTKIATCETLFSKKSYPITTSVSGIVMGMATLPAVKPGDPVCHIALPDIPLRDIKNRIKKSPKTLHRKIQKELSTNIRFTEVRSVS